MYLFTTWRDFMDLYITLGFNVWWDSKTSTLGWGIVIIFDSKRLVSVHHISTITSKTSNTRIITTCLGIACNGMYLSSPKHPNKYRQQKKMLPHYKKNQHTLTCKYSMYFSTFSFIEFLPAWPWAHQHCQRNRWPSVISWWILLSKAA